eukprot:XP_001705288.1 Hypothetical protein GL50803_35447 [Giardia lamblia ATCC 50803]
MICTFRSCCRTSACRRIDTTLQLIRSLLLPPYTPPRVSPLQPSLQDLPSTPRYPVEHRVHVTPLLYPHVAQPRTPLLVSPHRYRSAPSALEKVKLKLLRHCLHTPPAASRQSFEPTWESLL